MMKRTEEDMAVILMSRKVLNAQKVEELLHRLFQDARFEMREGKKEERSD